MADKAGTFIENRGWEVEVAHGAADLIREMCFKVQTLAVELAPVRTGFLRRSIEPEFEGAGEDLKGYVIAKTDYAAAVELGHEIWVPTGKGKGKTRNTGKKTEPRPYLRPALHAVLRQYTKET